MDWLRKLFFLKGPPSIYLEKSINCHNVRVWGTQNAHEFVEHVRDSPKVNFFMLFLRQKFMGHFS